MNEISQRNNYSQKLARKFSEHLCNSYLCCGDEKIRDIRGLDANTYVTICAELSIKIAGSNRF